MWELMKKHNEDWKKIGEEYQVLRKPNGDAVQDLSVNNYLVMRNKVADPDFLLLQKIERRFSELYPDKYFPLYTMVSFTDIEYKTALEKGNAQENIIKELIKKYDFNHTTPMTTIDDVIHQYMTKNVLI
jgi:kynurenine 3-monooxygenase